MDLDKPGDAFEKPHSSEANLKLIRIYKLWEIVYHYIQQEVMESFAFPDKINSISTEITQKCSKLFFSL